MSGLQLRSIYVHITFNRLPIRIKEGGIVDPIPANRPGNNGTWRPGSGSPRPIKANSPDETEYIPSPMVLSNPAIEPIPARSY